MKKIFLLFLILFSFNLVYSQDVYYINSGETVEINEWEICHEVTNNGVFNLMVPTKSSFEWSDFINDSPSFVSFADCGTNNFGDGSDGNIWVKSDGIYQDLGSGYNKLYDGTQWPSIQDGDMIVINARDFQVDSGATFTTTKRCRGLMIYTTGDMIVNGTISMTARGAHANPSVVGLNSDGNSVPDEGIVIRRHKSDWSDVTTEIIYNAHANSINDFQGSHNSNDLFYGTGSSAILSETNQEEIEDGLIIKIPKIGGKGARATTDCHFGVDGQIPGNSELFSLGGGGGGARNSGSGGSATCFSGGSAAGSGSGCPGDSNNPSSSVNNYGGSGGVGTAEDHENPSSGGGGAGNPGGSSQRGHCYAGNDGTGGLLIINVQENFIINGNIESKGSKGGNCPGYNGYAGGGSGGGFISLFYGNSVINNGLINVDGGPGGIGGDASGGIGGKGSIIGPLKIQKGYEPCNYGEIRINGVCKEIDGITCKEILDRVPSSSNGVYFIDPDMEGPVEPREVYCDMITQGGGWTLVVGIDASNRNHVNSADVTPENIVDVNGKGKFNDAFINAVQNAGDKKLRLEVIGHQSPAYPSGGDIYTNCNFGADKHPYYQSSGCYIGSGGSRAYHAKLAYGVTNCNDNWYGRMYAEKIPSPRINGVHEVWVSGQYRSKNGRLWAR